MFSLYTVGCVSANLALRAKLAEYSQQSGIQVFFPRNEFCTDNGAMIAYAGYRRYLLNPSNDDGLQVRPRWPLSELRAV